MTVTIYGDRDAVIGHLSESSLKSEKATVIVGQEPDIQSFNQVSPLLLQPLFRKWYT